MKYLLEIHIGPVQEFIAAARRSRDLWFGSWLLSELSKAAARAIATQEGIEALIFPAPNQLEDLEAGSSINVANNIVALISNEPKIVAENARGEVFSQLHDLRDQAIPESHRTKLVTWDNARRQIDELIEYYCNATPYSAGSYSSVRQTADAYLAARKNTRNFDPVGSWQGARPKSSLDGKRESIIPKMAAEKKEAMYQVFHARKGEHLSGVDLLKRRGNRIGEEREPFPSTSHMAAISLKSQLEKLEMQGADTEWQRYLAEIPKFIQRQERVYHDLPLPLLGDLDGSLLFESRFLDYKGYVDDSKLKGMKKGLQTFYKKTELAAPYPYYALFVGDGDFMGKAINALKTPEANQSFSKILANFARDIHHLIRAEDGAVIYAGGDDVLALLPLHTAVSCTAKVASHFRQAMKAHPIDEKDNTPTFSAGLAIVHHLEPLEDALEWARKAEREAKSLPTKDGLAVALVKRSGAPRLVSGRWGGIDKRLLQFATLHQQQRIPDRLAYQLRSAYLTLSIETDEFDPEIVLAYEAERLISRKNTADGKDSLDETVQTMLSDAIKQPDTTVDSVAAELMIAAEIVKVCNIAGIKLASSLEEVTV